MMNIPPEMVSDKTTQLILPRRFISKKCELQYDILRCINHGYETQCLELLQALHESEASIFGFAGAIQIITEYTRFVDPLVKK